MRLINWLLSPLKERWQQQAREQAQEKARQHWEPLLQTTKARLNVCEIVVSDQTKRMNEYRAERDASR